MTDVVAGIWPEGADGTDVNACSRSNKHHLVASADDFGKVNLYGYPCNQPKVGPHNVTQFGSEIYFDIFRNIF